MKIPILSGIFSDANADYRTSYPVNLVPVPKQTGVSDEYLKPAPGIDMFTRGIASDRGGIVVNGLCYRVMGPSFVRILANGVVEILGNVGGVGQVSLCYSFDNIGICSNGNLFYWAIVAETLTQVTDVNLGVSKYVVWMDGYFMSTDGEFLVVSDINNPFVFNPIRYGSAEVNPDPILAIQALRNQPCAMGRYSIEIFQNAGRELFPFERMQSAYIQRGTIGPNANCVFEEKLCFLGGGINEPPAIWLAINGQSSKISTREIDVKLQEFTEAELANVLMETRSEKSHRNLYVHLPDGTLVYDAASSEVTGLPVWYVLSSSLAGGGIYRARNFLWVYDKWLVGDPLTNIVGQLVNHTGSCFGESVGWKFQTTIIYNGGKAGIFWELELMCLTGTVSGNPIVITDYSNDQGVTWSIPRARTAGRLGEREKRINWLQNGTMNDRRIQRFYGNSSAHLTIAALETRIEPMYN